MKRHVFSDVAETDIVGIVEAISKDNPRAAEKWFDVLEEKCRKLAKFPRMGRQRDDLRPGVYCFPYGDYLIFYDITDAAVIVVHVVHGARNLPEVFRSEEAEEKIPSETRQKAP